MRARLGPNFNVFDNELNFLLGGMLFEDVGVTAYAGAATVLKEKEHLKAAAGILAVEAYHMGMARSQLYEMGEEAWGAANALSDARDKLDGLGDEDQGIRVDGKANIVPSTPDGALSRELRRTCCTSSPDGAIRRQQRRLLSKRDERQPEKHVKGKTG